MLCLTQLTRVKSEEKENSLGIKCLHVLVHRPIRLFSRVSVALQLGQLPEGDCCSHPCSESSVCTSRSCRSPCLPQSFEHSSSSSAKSLIPGPCRLGSEPQCVPSAALLEDHVLPCSPYASGATDHSLPPYHPVLLAADGSQPCAHSAPFGGVALHLEVGALAHCLVLLLVRVLVEPFVLHLSTMSKATCP